MIDGVKRAEVLLFPLFFPFHIQLQSEAVKAAEAVKHRLTQSLTQTHAHYKNA